MTAAYQTLALDLDADGILTVTLNRPDQLNSFTPTMANELVQLFTDASDDDAVRAVVVTGAGRAYCAGMDLSADGNVFGLDESLQPTLHDLRERYDDPLYVQRVRDTGGRVVLSIFDCKKPVIAAINGPAVGIGATMTLPMDIRLASDKARIGFVFGRIGIVPEACSSWFLPRIVGLPQALEWCYLAEVFDAQEALRGKLVREVVPHDDLLPRAKDLARRITKGRSPVAIALTRQMLLRNPAQGHPRAAHAVDSLAVFYTSRVDGKEGVQAFRDKREPQFTSKASQMPPFYPWWE